MSWMRFAAIARKEILHILRDPRSLYMAIGTPALMLLLFGYALTFDLKNVPMVVLDWSKTPESRELISYFKGSPYFNVIDEGLESPHQIDQAINSRAAMVALVIPKDVLSIQAIFDGSDSNSALFAMEYVQSIVRRFSYLKFGSNSTLKPMIRVFFNPDLETQTNIVPNLIATIMMVISALLTSLTIAREWETGTMEQLISTPIKKSELLLGKLTPYFAIGLLDVVVIMLLAEYLFHVPLRGSVIFLLLMSMIFLIGALFLGLLISIIAKNQTVATQMAMVLTFLPSFLLSGFITPISNMPIFLQWLSHLVPARYFIELLRGIYLKGEGLAVLYSESLLLLVFSAVVGSVAFLKFQKKLPS